MAAPRLLVSRDLVAGTAPISRGGGRVWVSWSRPFACLPDLAHPANVATQRDTHWQEAVRAAGPTRPGSCSRQTQNLVVRARAWTGDRLPQRRGQLGRSLQQPDDILLAAKVRHAAVSGARDTQEGGTSAAESMVARSGANPPPGCGQR
jgi:hypothetical protein